MAQRKPVKFVSRAARIRSPADGSPFRIRLAGAYQPREEGFIGVDRIAGDLGSIDHIVDLKVTPWPIDDSVVDNLFAAFYFHRLTRDERHVFMDECWRVLKPLGQLAMVMPHWSSMRSITDPLGQWPPLCESSFMVYSKEWRVQEKMADLPIGCDFGSAYGYGHGLDLEISLRNEEFQQQAKKHWVNAITDLHVTLTAQK